MENLSAFTDGRKMSDVALAKNLIVEIAGHCWNGKSDMLHRVHDAVTKHARAKSKKPTISFRRLRGWYHGEAAHVRYHEMIKLAEVAQTKNAAREQLEHAKKFHGDFIAHHRQLAARLSRQEADFHSVQIGALRDQGGGLDRAGDSR